MVLIMDGEDIKAALPIGEAIKAVEEGFCLYAKGKVAMPQRTQIAVEGYEGLLLYMPA